LARRLSSFVMQSQNPQHQYAPPPAQQQAAYPQYPAQPQQQHYMQPGMMAPLPASGGKSHNGLLHKLATLVRTILYGVTTLFAFLTFVFSAALVGWTESKFRGYYSTSVELLVAGLLGMITIPALHFVLHQHMPTHILASTMIELAVLAVFWLLFLGGAAASTGQLPDLSACHSTGCSLAQAMQAFGFLTWIALTFLMGGVLAFGIIHAISGRSRVWTEELSGRNVSGKGGVPMRSV